MPAPQKLSSYESFHVSKVKSSYRLLFMADNDGMIYLSSSKALAGNWAGNKIMEGFKDRSPDEVASYNQKIIHRLEEFQR
jgi:hypothetical protein